MVRSNADRLASVVSRALGVDVPIRIRAWDCSEHGPPDAPTVVVRSRRALRHLVWQPGELGFARAYVSGDLDIEGDLTDALRSIWTAGATRPGPRRLVGAVTPMVRLGALGRRPSPPASEARLGGALHTRERDRAAISHHYDLSNEFYELLLDDSMAYSCDHWTNSDNSDGDSDGPGGLPAAQRAKLDLVCRKLALTEGAHLVDIGCGWGSLTLHAAQHYGARVTAVTLSSEQRDFVTTRAVERGAADRVDVSLTHYATSTSRRRTPSPRSRWASTSAVPSTRTSRRRSTRCCAPAGGRSCNRCHVATSPRVAARSSRPTSHPTCT